MTLGEGSSLMRDAILDALAKGYKNILLDLENVGYIDSAGPWRTRRMRCVRGCERRKDQARSFAEEGKGTVANHEADHDLRDLRGRESCGKVLSASEFSPSLASVHPIHLGLFFADDLPVARHPAQLQSLPLSAGEPAVAAHIPVFPECHDSLVLSRPTRRVRPRCHICLRWGRVPSSAPFRAGP